LIEPNVQRDPSLSGLQASFTSLRRQNLSRENTQLPTPNNQHSTNPRLHAFREKPRQITTRTVTFQHLYETREWSPIRDCPGRFILRDSDHLSIEELLGEAIPMHRFTPIAAKDRVAVARLDTGGIISYERPDGTVLHTLNTEEGLRRKLHQLGIPLNPA